METAGKSARVSAAALDLIPQFLLMVGAAVWTAYLIQAQELGIGSATNAAQFQCMLVAAAAYEISFGWLCGRTPGMLLLGLGRFNADGSPAGLAGTLLALAGKAASFATLGLAWALCDPVAGRLPIQDLISRTRISRAGPKPARPYLRWPAALALLALLTALSVHLAFGLNRPNRRAISAGLQELRSAISIYSADYDGRYPSNFNSAEFQEKYAKVPLLDLKRPGQAPSNDVEIYSFTDAKGKIIPSKLRNSGHWAFDPASGTMAVDSTDLDLVGRPWFGVGQREGEE